jgi:signal transduction histidine kinase
MSNHLKPRHSEIRHAVAALVMTNGQPRKLHILMFINDGYALIREKRRGRARPADEHARVLNGELLQVLGDALLRENYRTRQYQETAVKLEEVVWAKDRAHQELQKTAATLRESEDALRHAHDELESRVQRRTASLRKLSGRLQNVQDEERRKRARELHDSAGQYLAAVKMNLRAAGSGDTFNCQEGLELPPCDEPPFSCCFAAPAQVRCPRRPRTVKFRSERKF